MRVGWIAWAFVAGCSFSPVPATFEGTDAGGTTGSGSASGSGSGSSAGSAASGCTPGTRVCIDTQHSGSCDGSGHEVIDRDCPPGSTCGAGYCQPPPGAMPCTDDDQCSGSDVCDPYVGGGSFEGFCTGRDGAADTYSQCTGGDQCRTGVCTDGQCFTACTSQSDCPDGPDSIACKPGNGTLEGTSMSGLTTCVGSD
jgi:hypothetical protein